MAVPSAIVPYCSGSQIGYTVYFNNGTYATYILGVNATALPPNFAFSYSVMDALVFVASIIAVAIVAFYIGSGRLMSPAASFTLAIAALAIFGIGAMLTGNPLRPFTINCGTAGAVSVMVYDPLASLLRPSMLIAAIALVGIAIDQLLGRW